ncbi:hypothetical protein [Silvanigrella sp.]|jgi:hypothetical protein|uniref:hypothetical protein n=1 Tax=Silvanigrella sp. TaxID=2024976 RepID=UPI0037C4F019
MNKYIFNIFIIFPLFILSSCVSSKKKQELIAVKKEDPINEVVKTIKEKCYKASNPQFLADFSTDSIRLPPIEMEGAWKNNYNLLKTSVIGPLGEEYYSFDIDENKINYNSTSSNIIANDYFEQFSSLFSKIGAKGLRSFLCGEYAFVKQKDNNGIYIVREKKEKTDSDGNEIVPQEVEINESNNKYFSISNIDISGSNIEVQSYVSLTKNENGYAIIVNSRFYYGLFSQDTQVEVKWIAFVNPLEIRPTSAIFRSNENKFSIIFSEYQ